MNRSRSSPDYRAHGSGTLPRGLLTGFKIERIDEVDPKSWNEHVGKLNGSVFQTTYWAEYQRAYWGATPHYLRLTIDGSSAGQWLVLEAPAAGEALISWGLPGRAALAALPKALSWREGPVISPDYRSRFQLLSALEGLSRLVPGISVAESWLPHRAGDYPDLANHNLESGFLIGERSTIRIDVRPGIDELWRRIKGGAARSPVRKAQSQRVTIREVDASEDIARFHALIDSWRAQERLSRLDIGIHELAVRHMPGCATVFLAELDGEPVGGAGLWHFGAGAYLFSPVQSALSRSKKIYAGDLLIWEMICWCHNRGFTYLDLSGIAAEPANEKEAGIRRFKEKWGGEVYTYSTVQRPVRSWRSAALEAFRRRRVR